MGSSSPRCCNKQGVMLDAVFINAGVAKLAPFEAVGEEMWDATFNSNLKGPYFLIKALLPRLNQGAAIVLNGSIKPTSVCLIRACMPPARPR